MLCIDFTDSSMIYFISFRAWTPSLSPRYHQSVHVDGLMSDCSNSIATAMELLSRQSVIYTTWTTMVKSANLFELMWDLQ